MLAWKDAGATLWPGVGGEKSVWLTCCALRCGSAALAPELRRPAASACGRPTSMLRSSCLQAKSTIACFKNIVFSPLELRVRGTSRGAIRPAPGAALRQPVARQWFCAEDQPFIPPMQPSLQHHLGEGWRLPQIRRSWHQPKAELPNAMPTIRNASKYADFVCWDKYAKIR